jgi:hypothetical protein
MLDLDMYAEFTWDFGQKFFLETEVGNYIWSDPDYNGDNTIRPYDGTLSKWLGPQEYGRSKGTYRIGDYCGNEVKII